MSYVTHIPVEHTIFCVLAHFEIILNLALGTQLVLTSRQHGQFAWLVFSSHLKLEFL